MGHSNSNSNPNHLNHHGPKPNTHTAHQPTCAWPNPPPSFLFFPTNAAPQPTGHGPPEQLTSGIRLSAFPSSSRRSPLQLSRPRSTRSAPRQGAPTAAPFRLRLFLFSMHRATPLTRITANSCAPLRDKRAQPPALPFPTLP
jgi:hypothetical protein